MEQPYTVQVGLRMPETLNARLDEQAKAIGVSKNSLILLLVHLGQKVMDGDFKALQPK